jgi:general secretion pathway protein G
MVELLVVIGIIALLAAIVFPVYLSVRGKARQTLCLSNLRQIGAAISMYASDADEYFPYGIDPSDKYTDIWSANPKFAAQVKVMPMLHDLLLPYTRDPLVWKCTADTGFDSVDVNYSGGVEIPLDARPTEFEKYGTSYFYRTELALNVKRYSATDVYDPKPPYAEHGPTDVNVVMDGSGSWHGGYVFDQKRYNVLMEDGHVTNLNVGQMFNIWGLRLDRGK